MADHNFKFGDGWIDFVLEAVADMEVFNIVSGRFSYLGMMGAFGSSAHGRQTFIGPQPIFPMGRGIIYTVNPWNDMEMLPSSLEEQYMTSILFKKYNQVPLRKFMSPISHKMNLNDGHGIHDLDLIDKYNSEKVRQIWNDYGWHLRPRYDRSIHDNKVDGYSANCPKNAMKEAKKLKDEFRFPVMKNFL